MNQDIFFLKKTFQLAKKAEGFTSPNPLVGAVIVKNSKLIASGYHKRCGLPHAEAEAMLKVKKSLLRGSILYVNLEPCSHFGRTPPCLDQIIKNKFKKVVIASLDPNPKTKSIRKLKRAGIKVRAGLLEKEARKLNEVFFKNMQNNLPFVAAKTAQSLDGKIAASNGESKWITSSSARKFAKSLRDKYDSILVGVNTVIKDNPGLKGLKRKPFKIVIDPALRIPMGSNILKENPDKLIIFTSLKKRKQKDKLPAQARIFYLSEKRGRFSLKEILKLLYKSGIMSVFVEGGAQTLGGFFDEKLVDKVYFFIAPKIIGGKDALGSVGAQGISCLKDAPLLADLEIKLIGKDILISGYPVKGLRR
jgi:diaminohydroxyphosphoribosylaminopyrimidine deaminase/5-amino-6-(5-phosphoribosylamino)uracil reductase